MGLFDSRISSNNTNAASEVNEFDVQLKQLSEKKEGIIFSIGKLYVELNDSQAAAGTPFEEPVLELEKVEREIVVVEKRKLAAKGLRKCENCGNVLVLDSAFCNKCGEKLGELFSQAEDMSNICTQCGEPYEEGVRFCTRCGNKLA